MARDGFRNHWARIAGVTLLNLFGVLATAAVFLGVAAYARHLEGGGAKRILGIELALSTESRTLWTSIAVLGALGILGAIAMYAAEWQITRIAAAYQRKCAQRLLGIASSEEHLGWQALVDGSPRSALQKLLYSAKITAFALRSILRVILPVIIVLISATALVIVDAMLTALLLPVLAVYLIPLYLVNRGVSRQQRAFKEISPRVKRQIGDGLRALDASETLEAKNQAAVSAFEGEAHDEAATLFWKRRLANQRVQMVNMSFFIICLLALFVFFGLKTQSGERTWAEFLIFIVALRFVFYGVRKTTSRLVKLSRFLHEYRAYSEFIDEAEQLRRTNETPARALPDALIFRCGKDGLWNSAPRLRLARGESAIVLVAQRTTAGMLEAVLARLSATLKERAELLRRSSLAARELPELVITTDGGAGSGESGPRTSGGVYSIIVSDSVREALAWCDQRGAGDRIAGVIVLEGREILGCGEGDWLRANHEAVATHLEGVREDVVIDDEVELDDEEEEDEE